MSNPRKTHFGSLETIIDLGTLIYAYVSYHSVSASSKVHFVKLGMNSYIIGYVFTI